MEKASRRVVFPVQGTLRVVAQFQRPILSWQRIPERYFEALYRKLGEYLHIRPNDFFLVASGSSPADVRVGFRILGGANSIVLNSEGVVIEFPGIGAGSPDGVTESSMNFSNYILGETYKALTEEFSEFKIRSINGLAAYHLKIAGDVDFEQIVEATSSVPAFSKVGEILDAYSDIGFRTRLTDKKSLWTAVVLVEPSYIVKNGIFLSREVLFERMDEIKAVDELFALTWKIDQTIQEAFRIEIKDLQAQRTANG